MTLTPNPPIPCELEIRSDMPHLQQIYSGFAALSRRRVIHLKQIILPAAKDDPSLEPHLRDRAQTHLKARIAGVTVAFDVHDAGTIDAKLLSQVQFYFKRSWEAAHVAACDTPSKIIPLGPNVWVHGQPIDWFALQRARLHGPAHALKSTVRAFGLDRCLGNTLFTPRVADLFAPAPLDAAPRILFLAEAWDPAQAPSAESAKERIEINALRAQCMRALRANFGDKVTCGFRPSDFAKKEFPDLAIPNPRLTSKPSYLALVREHAICIATTGLHHSIGWKFAEYLSMGRAIVSERLHMRLPGALAANTHFLEFTSPNECANQVERLAMNPSLRQQLMNANAQYYRDHVQPSALVGAAIGTVLGTNNPALNVR
jgi:hypothetical protein